MTLPLVDLVAQYRSIKNEVDRAIQTVLERGAFILGPNVEAFEREIAAYLGVEHAVGVASGTDALLLVLRALGVGRGDEIIVPAYTFYATAEVVSLLEATPRFVDIDPRTYCLNVAEVAAAITPRTRAIIPVHLYGHPADMAPVLELAKARGLAVVEDNAQAIGAEYRGQKTGSLGHAGCLSFFPSKNLGGYGDGGMIVTNDPALAESVAKLRTHGGRSKYEPEMVGYNSRLDELQAAILRVKLRHLDRWNERRRAVARTYHALLRDTGIGLPTEASYARHAYHLYVIRLTDRKAVQEHLRSCGIASGVYYPLPLHQLKPYAHLEAAQASFPHAERASQETLAIPLYPELTEGEIARVTEKVKEVVVSNVSRP